MQASAGDLGLITLSNLNDVSEMIYIFCNLTTCVRAKTAVGWN